MPGAEQVTEDGKTIHGWNGPDDPDNPFNWSPWYKWVLTVTICFVSILTGLPAGSYGSGASAISSQFGVLNKPFDNTIWATVSWNMGAAVWPLIFVPLTESKGRMPGYVVCLSRGIFVKRFGDTDVSVLSDISERTSYSWLSFSVLLLHRITPPWW